MNSTHIIVQGPTSIIDEVNPITGRSAVCGETLEQIRKRYPKAEIVTWEPWLSNKEKAHCTEPQPIDKDRFMEMLEVLPPQRWQHGKNCESFELMEHYSGRVTSIYARFGNRYFEWMDVCGQSLAAHATHCGQMAGK